MYGDVYELKKCSRILHNQAPRIQGENTHLLSDLLGETKDYH